MIQSSQIESRIHRRCQSGSFISRSHKNSHLTPFRQVPHAWRTHAWVPHAWGTHTSTARYKQIPLEKSKIIDIDGSRTLQLVLIDSIMTIIPQKQAFQYNLFNSWLGFSSITMMEKRHRAISNFWLSAVEFTFRMTIMRALARQYYNIRKYNRWVRVVRLQAHWTCGTHESARCRAKSKMKSIFCVSFDYK